MAAVRHFCWAGLTRSGIYAEMLHTPAFDRRLAHLSCFAGMAFVLSMCAVAESSCDSGSTRSVTAKSGKTSTHSEDPALSFFLMAFKALAMVSHCMDASDWPLTVAEFSANFQLFVEHGHCGFRWMQPRRGLPFISGVSGATLHDGVPSIHRGIQNHAEVHMRINWAMGAWDNRMYWEDKMRNSAQQLKELKHKHPEELCELLTTQKGNELRVLILGTGPVAAERQLQCPEGVVFTTSCDAFSRLYRELAKETGFQPPHGFPEYCDVEELWQFFPKDYFHLVFVSNALDHTVHPIRSLKLLLWVLHPDGKLMLRHFRNVHPEKWTSLSDGQHQWGFDVDDDLKRGQSFLIWNHLHRWNVTQVLEEDGAKTTASFLEPFVEVEVRKTSSFKHSVRHM